MTNLTTLTDDQIRVKAAEACGWKWIGDYWVHPTDKNVLNANDELPDPLHDLNDAVVLAQKTGLLWSVGHTDDGKYQGRSSPVSVDADSPARALTLAVLMAMETQEHVDA